jgi:3-methyladenine DNA glycosylase Tag
MTRLPPASISVAIRKMLADYQVAYSSHDAAKTAAFFAAEGDRRTADGRVVRGRAQLAGAVGRPMSYSGVNLRLT